MTEITNDMVHASYKICKILFIDNLSSKERVNILHSNHGMNKSSARIYIRNYKCMIKGELYKSTMKLYATKYYLKNILLDNGFEILNFAINAVELHLKHQKDYNKLKDIRELIKKIKQIIDNDCSDTVKKLLELLN